MAFKTFTSGAVLTAAEINTYLMQQAVIVCTAATRPSAPVEGMAIYETDTDLNYQYTGSAWMQSLALGVWGTYTPTLTQVGVVTKTVSHASYTRLGRTIIGTVLLQVTGSGTTGTAISIELPVTAGIAGYAPVGHGSAYDSSVGNEFVGIALLATTTTLVIRQAHATAVDDIGTTFGLAVNDFVRVCFTYQAAS